MALIKAAPPAAAASESPIEGGDPQCDLRSSDVDVRRRAARALAALPGAAEMLCEHLAWEESLSVRSIIFTGLILHKSSAGVAGLLRLLFSEDANLRGGAVEALQEMPDEVAPHIEALLAMPDSDIRISTVIILASLPHPKVPVWLHRVVANDPHINVCAAALDALAEVGDQDVLPTLEALIDRFPNVTYIKFAVDAATRRIRGR